MTQNIESIAEGPDVRCKKRGRPSIKIPPPLRKRARISEIAKMNYGMFHGVTFLLTGMQSSDREKVTLLLKKMGGFVPESGLGGIKIAAEMQPESQLWQLEPPRRRSIRLF